MDTANPHAKYSTNGGGAHSSGGSSDGASGGGGGGDWRSGQERTTFLQAVLGDQLPDGLWAHVWHPSPNHTDWVRDVAAAERSAGRNGRRDVYIGYGLAGVKGAPNERVKAKTAAGLVGVGVDIDISGNGHKRSDLPPDEDAALHLLDELPPPPTLIVHSGHGLQAAWLFTTPWRFADDADQERAKRLGAAWHAYVNAAAQRHGWKIDNTGDLARVFRVAGTINAKVPRDEVPVRLLHYTPDARYTPSELADTARGAHSTGAGAGAGSDDDPVDSGQRFTSEHRCPICDGYEEMERGIGDRCWGFLGRGGDVAFCTREDYAGELEPHTTSLGSDVYAHSLWGRCGCGTTHQNKGQGDGPVEGRALWNARFFAGLYRDRLRYVAAWGRWYENNGKWWEPDEVKAATRLGYEAVDTLYRRASDEPDRKRKRELSELAVKLDVAANITAMVSAAGTFAPLSARGDQFDRDDWHVVAANGIIDLRTGRLLPHDPAALHSKHLGPTLASIRYDPDAQCPNWLAFLGKIFPEADGPDVIGYLARVAGYTLTGDISEQCMFILNGDGDNGKTTFTRAIGDVLGTYYDSVPPETLLSTSHERIPNDIAKLVGVRGVFASETEQNRRLAEALIKKVTGGEEVDARFLNHEWFKFRPKFKLWLHTNHIPKVRGKDKGIWRRLRVIPFTYTFTADEKQRDYYERVLRPELPGILTWMVRGGLDWQQLGKLGEPDRMTVAWAAHKETSDTLKQFIDDYVYRDDATYFLRSGVLYRAYCEVCRQQGEQPESQMALSLAIKAAYNVAPILRKGEGRGFYGLGVQSRQYDHE